MTAPYLTPYPDPVIRTTVMLPEEDKRALERLSARTGTSEAELIRQGVKRILAEAPRPRPRVGFISIGDGRSAAETDEMLREMGFGE